MKLNDHHVMNEEEEDPCMGDNSAQTGPSSLEVVEDHVWNIVDEE